MELRTFVVACLLGAALAGPVSRDVARCDRSCTSPGNQKIHSPEGKTLIYSYQGDTRIKMAHQKDDLVTMKLSATVHLAFLSGCDVVMRLYDVDFGSSEPLELKSQLEAHPLHFGYNDGEVSVVCVHDRDNDIVTNIKKAVLSVIQNKAQDLEQESTVEETDIFGTCKVTYKPGSSGWNSKTIIKSKNLQSCRNSQNSTFHQLAVSYLSENSAIRDLPIISGQSVCEQNIGNNKYIQSVKCHGTQGLSPISAYQGGIHIETQASMHLVKTRQGAESAEIGRPTNLLFATGPQTQEQGDERAARGIIDKLIQNLHDGVQIRTPYHLSMLVKALYGLSQQQIESIYEYVKPASVSNLVEDMFIDAVGMTSTRASIGFMAKMIREDKLDELRTQTFFTLLAYNTHPNESVIQVLIPFLKDPSEVGQQAIFGITALCNNFCNQKQFQNNSRDCRDTPAIQQVIEALSNILGNGCQTSSPAEEEEKVQALIGFKNLGRVGSAKEQIARCFTNKDNSNAVRVAALRALTRVPRIESLEAKMLPILQDSSDDSEVRIRCFRMLMRWGSRSTVETSKNILRNQPVSQVSAYIWSYLTNMQETSSPFKTQIREIVGDKTLSKKFPQDFRKTSQYAEWSMYSTRANVGYDVEADVIHHKDSFLPRAVGFNTSLYLFGQHINPFALNLRAENLDSLFEHLFGPNGKISGVKFSDVMEMLGYKEDDEDSSEDSNEDDTQISRNPRSLKEFNRLGFFQEKFFKAQGKPRAALDVTIMGHTIARVTSANVQSLVSSRNELNVLEIIQQLAKNQEVERSYSAKIFDFQVIVPTLSGMLLNVQLNATATGAIKAKGKIDIKDLLTEGSRSNVDINGYIIPSAALEVVAACHLKTGGSTPGVKAVFQSHTSQHLQGKLQWKNGRIALFKVDTPKPKIDLVTVKYDMYKITENGNEQPIIASKSYSSSGCTNFLSQPLGGEICYRLEAPKPILREGAPILPLYGGAVAQITLKKTDQNMQGYEFSLEAPAYGNHREQTYKVEFNTPGSSVNRHFALEVHTQCSSDEHAITAKLVSPIKKINAEAFLKTDSRQSTARASVVIDDKKRYAIESQVQIEASRGQLQLRPSITISLHGQKPTTLKGTISSAGKGNKLQINVDLQSNKPSNQPAYLRGTFTKDGEFSSRNPAGQLKIASDLNLVTPLIQARVHALVSKLQSSSAVDFGTTYKLLNQRREHSAKLTLKLQNLGGSSATKISTVADIHSTQFPGANSHVNWQFTNKGLKHIENQLEVKTGDSSSEPQLSIHQISKLETPRRDYRQGKSEHSLEINTPWQENAARAELKAEWDQDQDSQVSLTGALKVAEKPIYKGSVDFNGRTKSPIQMNFNAELETPHRVMKYQDSIKERSPNEYEGRTSVQWQRGQQATVDYIYRRKSNRVKSHHEMELKMMTPSMKIPMQQRALLRVTRDTLDVRSHTQIEGEPVYSLEVKLDPKATSNIDLSFGGLNAGIQYDNDEKTNKLKYHASEEGSEEEYSGSFELTGDEKSPEKRVALTASWGKPSDNSKQIQAEAKISREGGSHPEYDIESNVQIGKRYRVEAKGQLSNELLEGPHKMTIKLDGQRIKSQELEISHELEDGTMNCELTYSVEEEEQLKFKSVAKYQKESSESEYSYSVIVTSPIRAYNGKELSFSLKRDESSQAKTSLHLRGQVNPGKPYTFFAEAIHPSRGQQKFHSILTTPHPGWASQDFTVAYERKQGTRKIDADITTGHGKKLHASATVQRQGSQASGHLQISTSFDQIRSAEVITKFNHNDGITAEVSLSVNGNKKFGTNARFVNSNHLDAFLGVTSDARQKYNVQLRAFKDDKKRNFEYSLKKNGDEVMASKFLWEKEGKNQYNGHAQMKNDDFNWILDAKTNQDRNNLEYSLSSRGLGSPVKATAKWAEDRDGYQPELHVCSPPGSGKCMQLTGKYLNKDRRGQLSRAIDMAFKSHSNHAISFNAVLENKEGYYKHLVQCDILKRHYENSLVYDDEQKDVTKVYGHYQTPNRKASLEAQLKEDGDKNILRIVVVPRVIAKPSGKLVAVLTQQEGDNQLHYSAIITHPDMDSPKKASLDIINKPGSVRPFEAKLNLVFSPQSVDQIYAVLYLEDATQQKENITMGFEAYDAAHQNLNLLVKGHVGNVGDQYSAGAQWTAGSGRQKIQGNWYAEMDTEQQESHVYYRGLKNQAEGHASWEVQSNKLFEIEQSHRFNDEEGSVKFTLNIPDNCGELTIFDQDKSPNYRYHACVLSPSSGKHLSLTAESYKDNEKQTDLSIGVTEVDSERVLRVHAHWQPELPGEFFSKMLELSDNMDVDDIVKPLKSYAKQANKHLENFQDNVIEKAFGSFNQELQSIRQELKYLWKALGKFLSSWPDFSEYYDDVVEGLNNYYEDITSIVEDLTPRWVQNALRNGWEAVNGMGEYVCGYRTYCYQMKYAYGRHGMEGLVELVYSAVENMPPAYFKLIVAVKNMARFELPEISFEPLSDAYEYVVDVVKTVFEPLMSSDLANEIGEFFEEQYKDVQEQYEKVVEYLEDHMEGILKNDEVKAIISAARDFYQALLNELKKLHLDKATQNASKLLEQLRSAEPLKDSIRVITMDPESGNFEAKIRYPEMRSIHSNLKAVSPFFHEAEKPSFNQNQAENEYDEDAEEEQDEEPYYNIPRKSIKNISKFSAVARREWAPPFKGQAQIVSGLHFKTFDNTFYDFKPASGCSYLLARDFHNGNFSLIAKNHQGPRGEPQLVIYALLDKDVISVNTETGLTKYNDQEVELPLYKKMAFVTGNGQFTTLSTKRGLTVTMDHQKKVVTGVMSGWYTGKTGGLWGTYDHEPSNDFTSPKGHLKTDVHSFARSWEASSSCQAPPTVHEIDVNLQEPKYNICKEVFQRESSPFSSSFQELNNTAYFRICARQVTLQPNPENAMCAIATAYKEMASQEGYKLTLPQQCRKCQSPSGSYLNPGERQSLSPSREAQSADIVLLLEEDISNQQHIQDLGATARAIDAELNRKGLRNNQFAVIGFGGKQERFEPHLHTASGQEFYSADAVPQAVRKIQLRERKASTDTLVAIQFAINTSSFRAGVSKNIILLQSSPCQESQQVDYSKLEQVLLSHGIIFHTLTSQDLLMRGAPAKNRGLYGVDVNSVYRKQDVSQRQLIGSPDLRQQVAIPKDLCSEMALSVNGSVFTTQPASQGQAESKNWRSVVARRVAESALPHQCQECQCQESAYGAPQTVCKPCRPLSPKTPSNSYRNQHEYDEDEDEDDEN